MTDFEEIYKKHFRDIFLFIKSLSHDEQLAEEITAETFFKALNTLNDFRGDCDVRVWLCQIAKNCYFTHLRKNRQVLSMDNIESPREATTLSVEEIIATSEDIQELHRLLHNLEEPYKEVFTLRVFAELSFKQIGEVFGKTDNWACVTFHRAKSKLKQKMEEIQ